MISTQVAVATVVARTANYVNGLAAVVEELLELTGADVLLMACEHANGLDVIGRARPRAVSVDLRDVMRALGGGGHARAAAAAVPRGDAASSEAVLERARDAVLAQIPEELAARDVMTADVVTLQDSATVAQARDHLARHGLKAVPVVDGKNRLRGSLKVSDVVKAERAGRGAATVKGVMKTQVVSVGPATPFGELEAILVTTVGRVPVIDDAGHLLGIVTRTDILRQRNYYADSTL